MKTEITEKQMKQFNIMRFALIDIAKNYKTPAQIRRDSEKQYGLDFDEAIEFSYENIQSLAKMAVKGVKSLEAK